jgi:hypothetical protein
MSIQTNALALHEILLSISDSLNKAQNELRSMPPFDEFGRPNTIYQLPYLDFNLEVISEFSSPTATPGTNVPALPAGSLGSRTVQLAQVATGNYLKFVPFAATDYSRLSKNKITSVIAGRFVAVLPNDGLPQVYVFCQATLMEATPTTVKYRIAVRLQNATGDPLDGQRVEVNFDEQNSLNINGVDLQADPVFTLLKDGFTGSSGTAGEFVTTVELSVADYYAPRTFIFVANSGTLFSSVGISNS